MSKEKLYVADVSRGKDSTAMLEAIRLLGLPLDAIVAVDIWFDDETPGELPYMVDFKNEWDRKCFERYGIPVTRLRTKFTYKGCLLREGEKGKVKGFPSRKCNWCNSKLKVSALSGKNILQTLGIENRTIVHYVGIAADEPERIKRHGDKKDIVMPLVMIGWEEELCGVIAQCMDMLSPTYEDGTRDGCWFCYNQRIDSLRTLYTKHRELWDKLIQLEQIPCVKESPNPNFLMNRISLSKIKLRFDAEQDNGIQKNWRWSMLENGIQTRLFKEDEQ